MVGRAAEGRPWLPGALAAAIAGGTEMVEPPAAAQAQVMFDLYRETVDHYADGHGRCASKGRRLGVRMARKHLAAFASHLPGMAAPARQSLRGALCSADEPDLVLDLLADLAAGGTAALTRAA
jgi:tRNA-dihydrouridine synthase